MDFNKNVNTLRFILSVYFINKSKLKIHGGFNIINFINTPNNGVVIMRKYILP